LLVELDGGQHADDSANDQERSSFLEKRGYRVLRFWDNEVLENMDAVLEVIVRALDGPHPSLSHRARV
jgi:very-short-patch-repair endonuclease